MKDFERDDNYKSLIAAVQQSVRDVASEGSSPADVLSQLKQERKEAKAKSIAKTKEVKAYSRRVARLQTRAKKLSDDSLLIEYSRRQAEKAKKSQEAGERGNP